MGGTQFLSAVAWAILSEWQPGEAADIFGFLAWEARGRGQGEETASLGHGSSNFELNLTKLRLWTPLGNLVNTNLQFVLYCIVFIYLFTRIQI